jgi:hypothetical protein
MDKKPHEKLRNPPSRGQRRVRPRLRLIQGEQAEDEPIAPAHAAHEGRPSQTSQCCSDDDDNPPPTAA